MAAKQPGVWGIDIGQCALKALRVENINGKMQATAVDYIEHPKILSQPDADPDQLAQESLEKFLSRNTLKGDFVAIGIPGQSGLARFVKLPPVEEKKIGDIVRFEAKQQIPFNLDEVIWDYQKIGSGVVTDGFAMETEIGLFAIKKETVHRALEVFQHTGVEVDLVQMAPLALCNMVAYDQLNKEPVTEIGDPDAKPAKKVCVVALDIGVEVSNLVITDGERVIWQRPIPIGGNRFTRALTRDLKLTFAKAEHLKRNAMKSPDLKRILLALKADLNEFVTEVQRSLGYFSNTHRDAEVRWMVGLGNAFRLPGLQKFLSEKLHLDVRKIQKFNRLTGDNVMAMPLFQENILTFAVAYGLAIQGVKLSRLHTNLLPKDISTRRLIRSKKPWAAAAAAAMLLGVATMTFGFGESERVAKDTRIKDAVNGAKSVLGDALAWRNKVAAAQSKADALEASLKTIVSGHQNQRLNWLVLTKHINNTVPWVDGSNLSADKQKIYMTDGGEKGGDGKAAFDKMKARQKDPKARELQSEFEKKNLVQVSIEAVIPYYTDNLTNYFNNVKNAKEGKLEGMPVAMTNAPPSGPGWVVELRGYTYHRQERQFLIDTLMENLGTKPVQQPVLASDTKSGDKTLPPTTDKKSPPPTTPTTDKKTPPSATDKKVPPATDKKAPAVAAPGAGGYRISHPVLLAYKSVPNPTGDFQLINTSQVPRLLGVAAPAAAKGRPPAGASSVGAWRPLGGAADNLPAEGEVVPGVDPAGAAKKGAAKDLWRTEFVVLFVWQEPS